MTIFLMAVHTSGHGFAVDSRWNVVFKRVDNAAGWCRDAMKNGLVKSVSEGWLPTQAVGLPDWIKGLPAEEFDSYYFHPGVDANEHP